MSSNHIKFPDNEVNFNKASLLKRLLKFNSLESKLSYIDDCLFHWYNLARFNASSTLDEMVEFGNALKHHLMFLDVNNFYSPGVSTPAEFNIVNYEQI